MFGDIHSHVPSGVLFGESPSVALSQNVVDSKRYHLIFYENSHWSRLIRLQKARAIIPPRKLIFTNSKAMQILRS